MTRQKKTPRQRAEETLGVAQRRVERLYSQWLERKDELEELSRELDQARQRLEYAQQDPALQSNSTTTTTDKSGDTA